MLESRPWSDAEQAGGPGFQMRFSLSRLSDMGWSGFNDGAMKFPNALKAPLMDAVDTLMSWVPNARPPAEILESCKVVAHRGLREGTIKENTLEAFRRACAVNTWGIEFDIRWCADGQGVVHHDASLDRVFNDSTLIENVASDELCQRTPEIPTLRQLIAEFGGRVHLMIELKGEPETYDKVRVAQLAANLSGLEPIRDYHLICLKTETLLRCEFAPRNACLPIAEFNCGELSRLALEKGFGGITGQYLLMNQSLLEAHHRAGQQVGTGFIGSKNVLYRELNRGVDWIFTDHVDRVISMIRS